VHTGEVDEALDVVLAAAGAAGRGDVLVSQTVVDLVGGSGLVFAEGDGGGGAAAGVPGEWHRLDAGGSGPEAGGVRAGPLVGRARELDLLERALRRTQSGSGATVLIAGESGIGKTRLVSEIVARARTAGFDALVGRCLDLVGTELPYAPFVEALRAVGRELPFVDGSSAPSQLRVFEETLALLDGVAVRPLLLVVEDVHWADTSTLDLIAYLAHNVDMRSVLLLATYRPDEPASAERLRRLAESAGRAGTTLAVELGPLAPADLTALIEARAGAPPSPALADAIVARSEGNPFFAEELVAAGGDATGELPRGLRDLLLRRLAQLDRRTKAVLRLAAAAGRDVGYPLLRAAAALPEPEVRESLRLAVEHGVLVAADDRFRFRHALLAEAVYSTLLPGEREELHARLADELSRGEPPAAAAELAPHWAAAGRSREALIASVDAARAAEAVFGLPEALSHLERALRLWPAVPDAAELVGFDLAELSSRAADLGILTGVAPRAVELGTQAVALVGDSDAVRAGLLHARVGRSLLLAGRRDAALASFERAVELVPGDPPSVERANVVAALGHVLMLLWRHGESLVICEQALTLARAVGPGAAEAELRALIVFGVDLAYLGRGEEGLATLREALRLAEASGGPDNLVRAYTCVTDVLTMLGRPRESARLAAEAVEIVRRYGIEHGPLAANQVEALVAAGEWDEADRVSAVALRANTANWPHYALGSRAEIEVGRGEFVAARTHLDAALPSVREDVRGSFYHDPVIVELALWEDRFTDADEAVREGLALAHADDAALYRVRFCAQGLRAQAGLAALARGRDDSDALAEHLDRARTLLDTAQSAAAQAASVTPNAAGWRLLAEGEYARACDVAVPETWSEAAATWEQLERPPVVAYCRWREAEALAATGGDPSGPLREARAVAARIGARPLLRELELLAERAGDAPR
jgi:tetratricopeptide (TPR) repeat protein